MRIFGRMAVTAGVAVAGLGLAAPAFANVTSVSDPEGDVPDIVRLSVNNKQAAVVLTQTYVDIELVQVESLYIMWGGAKHYRINRGNYDEDPALETRFILVTPNGEREKQCADLRVRRSVDLDRTKVIVPRSCLGQAPNRIQGKGVASMGLSLSDQTRLTKLVARG